MLIVAHRGAHGPETPEVGENTLDAFRAATELGVDGVELDVRRTADGVLVVHHDAALPDGRVIAETAAVDLPDRVPTFAGAMEACRSLRVVDVEIKNSPLEPGFDPGGSLSEAVVRAIDGRRGILVTSFNLASLDEIRRLAPSTQTGWLTAGGYDQMAAIATTSQGGHTAVAVPDSAASATVVGAAHQAGLTVFVWTVNDGARMQELAELGADGVITDRPRLARTRLPG